MKYNEDDIKIMKATAQSKNKSRLCEIINFAKSAGYQKIGIAACICMKKPAQILLQILQNEGFTVEMIHCRESGFDGGEICDTMTGSCCDPLSQAQFLNQAETELNIMLGLCVGHGLIFEHHSQAPCTTFAVKDFATGHNPLLNLTEKSTA